MRLGGVFVLIAVVGSAAGCATSQSGGTVAGDTWTDCRKADGSVVSIPRSACERQGWESLTPVPAGTPAYGEEAQPLTKASNVIDIDWPAQPDITVASVSIFASPGFGTIFVRVWRSDDECLGHYRNDSSDKGTWQMDCGGARLQGTFSGFGTDQLVRGTGRDQSGNPVAFVTRRPIKLIFAE